MEGYKFSFEKLNVWHLAKNLTIKIYKITSEFPKSEKYGLVSQINRAAVSVPSNIAEGSSRLGTKDKSHFYSIAYSSLMELVSHLMIAKDLDFLDDFKFKEIKDDIFEISNKLNALYRSERK